MPIDSIRFSALTLSSSQKKVFSPFPVLILLLCKNTLLHWAALCEPRRAGMGLSVLF